MKKDRTPKEDPLAVCHFNIRCLGHIVFNRVRANYFKGMRPEIISSAWCVGTQPRIDPEGNRQTLRSVKAWNNGRAGFLLRFCIRTYRFESSCPEITGLVSGRFSFTQRGR